MIHDQRPLPVYFSQIQCKKKEKGTGLDGPLKDQVGWQGYLNPKSGSPATILGSPTTFFATIL